MDLHIIPGVRAEDVAEAHRRDMLIQEEYGCKCMTYWIDEKRGNVFCLVEAPTKNIVKELHSKAHGLIPHRIIEVNEPLIEAFLGRISDPESAAISGNGLKIFHDPSFRTLLVTSILDPILIQHRIGREKANTLLNQHNYIIRKELAEHQGAEVENRGAGFIASFVSAGQAVSCALSIQKVFEKTGLEVPGFTMAIHAGEPVRKSDLLFGDVIQVANYLIHLGKPGGLVISSIVGELVAKDHSQQNQKELIILTPAEETFIILFFNKLEENWQNPDFDILSYGVAMSMSKSQLYRKVISLFGKSPILLLKKYRLEKACMHMKKRNYTISQITFESGFTSPSYFTKCFKKQYGLLPMEYLGMLHQLP